MTAALAQITETAASIAARMQPTLHTAQSPAPLSVLFATGSLSDESSGPYLSLKQTASALTQRGHAVTVLGTMRAHDRDLGGWPVDARTFRSHGPFSLHYAPGMAAWLRGRPSDAWDVVSLQGVWLHTNRIIAGWCIRRDKPFMITAHGNFNPVALAISAWKKRLARHSFLRPVFQHVACYQALTEIEYVTLRESGVRGPICVIGNGIDLPDVDSMRSAEEVLPKHLLARRTCLYLGRLHPIKGIDRLLRAWGRVAPGDDWQLVIAGDGEKSFRTELAAVAKAAQCRNVHFVGAVSGDVKSAWFRNAAFVVLPSHSEAFPMALLEAFSYGTPGVITAACGLPQSAGAGAAVEVESSDDGVGAGLEQMVRFSRDRLQTMGAAARAFVSEHYAWSKICGELESVYAWMQARGPKPSCLRTD